MSHARKMLLALSLCIIVCGPALVLPDFSPHRATLSAPAPSDFGSHRPGAPLLVSPLAGVAIVVKDPGTIAKKWKTRATAAQGDYGEGVKGAGQAWEANSAAAEDNYKTSVTQAAADGRYGKGVRGSGAKYQDRATTVGPQRYGTGVGAAENAMAAGMAGVVQVLQGINLPPRGVKGNNQGRSQMVADKLRAWKLSKA